MHLPLFRLLRNASFSIFFILVFSPLCTAVFTDTSYLSSASLMLKQLLQPQSLQFPASHWIREPFFFSNTGAVSLSAQFTFHDAATPLFPYLWKPYVLSLFRFLAACSIGFLVSSLLLWVFSHSSLRMKHCLAMLHFLPVTIATAFLQLSTLFLVLKWHILPHSSLLLIIVCASFVVPAELFHAWPSSCLSPISFTQAARQLSIMLVPQWKSIFISIWVSASLFEYMLYADGLVTFIMQYILSSPSTVAVGLFLLYIPYFFMSTLLQIHTYRKTIVASSDREPLSL